MYGKLEALVFNVEHGSCVFVRTPNNKTILIDCGGSQDFSPAEHLHTMWGVRHIDMLVISHPDHDHIQDLPNVLKRFSVTSLLRNTTIPQQLACPGGPFAPLADQLYVGLDRLYTSPCLPGLRYSAPANWGGVHISAAANPWFACPWMGTNNLSEVFRISYGGLDMLLPGDIEPSGVRSLMLSSDIFNSWKQPLCTCRVLIAPHHGRDSGCCPELVSMFTPNLAVMSDKYGSTTTNYGFYNNRCTGTNVKSGPWGWPQRRKVVTTKTNDYVLVTSELFSGVQVTTP